jgi:hypothetical protein
MRCSSMLEVSEIEPLCTIMYFAQLLVQFLLNVDVKRMEANEFVRRFDEEAVLTDLHIVDGVSDGG